MRRFGIDTRLVASTAAALVKDKNVIGFFVPSFWYAARCETSVLVFPVPGGP